MQTHPQVLHRCTQDIITSALHLLLPPFQPPAKEDRASEDGTNIPPFMALHDLALDDNDPLRIQNFSEVPEFEDACDLKKKDERLAPALLLFLRGYPSKTWLCSIGWKCDVDPEFFLRHLGIHSKGAEADDYFTLPALSSTSTNIIGLRVSTHWTPLV